MAAEFNIVCPTDSTPIDAYLSNGGKSKTDKTLGVNGPMQDTSSFLILEVAYNLAKSNQDAMRGIAKAAKNAISYGPVAIARFDNDAKLDRETVYFERAEQSYVELFYEWQRVAPATIRHLALSLTPRVVCVHPETCEQLSARLQVIASKVFPLCVMANTGDGGGLHIAFGNPDKREAHSARMHRFHAIAQHLAVAWRIRASLSVADKPSAVEATLHEDGTSSNLSPDPSSLTAREVLRRVVLAQKPARIGQQSVSEQVLWPALVAGRWSLLDVFTAAGMRYIVAHKNPAEAEPLRGLHPREQRVLELTLAGGSGYEIGLDLRLSEPAVTRTLRTALRKIGVADTAALAGVRVARFEPLEGLNVGVDLAIARLTPATLPLAGLSDAERAIVAGLLSGQRIAAIAHERGTSPRTVGNQISSIYRKLGISSRRELLALLI